MDILNEMKQKLKDKDKTENFQLNENDEFLGID